MKLSKRILSALLMISFILIAATTEMGLSKRICKAQSDSFSGVCFTNNNCAIICQLAEQFEDGQCEFDVPFPRCVCTKAC
ncbi:PREDICTED: defensin-like protein 8 [Camelina sativa]|uniref:Defensin-like protein 8 n=1 Tax=Camelina sativa TaxID=90675 RepID=A0ABM1RSU9_CAMSA|nr:PREDICTED: defensin-like protein 8 [Camelina sativa]